jgi:hypothetical protein
MFASTALRRATPRVAVLVGRSNGLHSLIATQHQQQQQGQSSWCRFFSVMPEQELNKRLAVFQDLFVEARYSIEDCTDAAETTYFDEEAEAAKEAVDAAVAEFAAILKDLDELDQKNQVLRGNGLKVEQLKGELQLALTGGHH